jgi:hypothetical protein
MERERANQQVGGANKDELETEMTSIQTTIEDLKTKIATIKSAINTNNNKQDALKAELISEVLQKIAQIDITTSLEDIESIIGTSNEKGKLLQIYSDYKQLYTTNIDLLIKYNLDYDKYKKIIEEMNTTMESGVAETVKYDEIKILVENGSYTVEQSRHLNTMESLFTKNDEETFALRARKEVEKKKTDELVGEVEKEIRASLDDKKDLLESQALMREQERIEKELKFNPELKVLSELKEDVGELKKILNAETNLSEENLAALNERYEREANYDDEEPLSVSTTQRPMIVSNNGSDDGSDDDNDLQQLLSNQSTNRITPLGSDDGSSNK